MAVPPFYPALRPYASDAASSRGRLLDEPRSPTRSEFHRDRDRIIHSTAFRRLKHKTQVFVAPDGDHFRTRLTHTIEVAQIARSLARALGLDEDLAETLALAHDLGHTPFGHAGEDALDAAMGEFGGFDHNAQSLRIVTRLEQRYADFDGLNLTWETLEGLVKHNGPLDADALPVAIAEYNARHDLWLTTHASLEAQVAALADDIAYNAHDIDDGLRAGLISLDDLADVPFAGALLAEVRAAYPHLETARTIHEVGRRLITRLIEDVIATTEKRIRAAAPAHADAVRHVGRTLVAFSPTILNELNGLRRFLFVAVYRHPTVMVMREQAQETIVTLFDTLRRRPDLLPEQWGRGYEALDAARQARRVADYIAGMTDPFALALAARIRTGAIA